MRNYFFQYFNGELVVSGPDDELPPPPDKVNPIDLSEIIAEGAGMTGTGTTITDKPIPQSAAPETTINDWRVPLAGISSWALLNLLLTIATGLVMLAVLISYFAKRREEESESGEYVDYGKARRKLLARIIIIINTIVAIILFASTQDLSLQMVLIDTLTIWHIILATVAVLLAFFSKKGFVELEDPIEFHP